MRHHCDQQTEARGMAEFASISSRADPARFSTWITSFNNTQRRTSPDFLSWLDASTYCQPFFDLSSKALPNMPPLPSWWFRDQQREGRYAYVVSPEGHGVPESCHPRLIYIGKERPTGNIADNEVLLAACVIKAGPYHYLIVGHGKSSRSATESTDITGFCPVGVEVAISWAWRCSLIKLHPRFHSLFESVPAATTSARSFAISSVWSDWDRANRFKPDLGVVDLKMPNSLYWETVDEKKCSCEVRRPERNYSLDDCYPNFQLRATVSGSWPFPPLRSGEILLDGNGDLVGIVIDVECPGEKLSVTPFDERFVKAIRAYTGNGSFTDALLDRTSWDCGLDGWPIDKGFRGIPIRQDWWLGLHSHFCANFYCDKYGNEVKRPSRLQRWLGGVRTKKGVCTSCKLEAGKPGKLRPFFPSYHSR
ncbi:hypothetical protein F4780DRAFT_107853 [Xylariomycetidae sp. FL0641]|nr:hypothetical protein F4780DRAFT_107853 [Xylariomycetidae sp. FL0641]